MRYEKEGWGQRGGLELQPFQNFNKEIIQEWQYLVERGLKTDPEIRFAIQHTDVPYTFTWGTWWGMADRDSGSFHATLPIPFPRRHWGRECDSSQGTVPLLFSVAGKQKISQGSLNFPHFSLSASECLKFTLMKKSFDSHN